MKKVLKVNGNNRLYGSVTPSGFKHSAVSVINCGLLFDKLNISNIPRVRDVFILSSIFSGAFGYDVSLNGNTLTLSDTRQLAYEAIDYNMTRQIHGSLYLIPLIAIRYDRCPLFMTGGDSLTPGMKRRYEHILETVEKFGMTYKNGILTCRHLYGATIDTYKSRFSSDRSGITKTALITGSCAKGKTVILHPYMAQDVIDLIRLLTAAGVGIEYHSDMLVILDSGIKQRSVSFCISPDLIEISSLIALSGITQSIFTINSNFDDILYGLKAELSLFHSMGFRFYNHAGSFDVYPPKKLHTAGRYEFAPYPGAYSDNQAIFASLLLHADGQSKIIDLAYPERNTYVEAFRKAGFNISTIHGKVVIRPEKICRNKTVYMEGKPDDLRTTMAQLLCLLGMEGENYLTDYEALFRGYANFLGKLRSLHADLEETIL